MKILLLSLLMLLASCSQLMNGQQQPVRYYNIKNNIMYTTCSGAVEHWGSCNQKAMNTCKNGYSIVEKNEDSNGAIRTLIFKCN